MIKHSVIFKLKFSKGSPEEKVFFEKAKQLVRIPGVQNFECLEQFNPKNKFEYGLSMEFANEALYNQYNNHPDHTAFVRENWMKYVEDFLEIDYRALEV